MNLLPQFGFSELILIAVVALIVVGPKDLPKLMRSAGQFVAKARRMAGEFTSAFDQMARESEMDELRQEIEALKKDNVFTKTKQELDESLAPLKDELGKETGAMTEAIDKVESGAETGAEAAAPADEPVKPPAGP
ncbi:Twin-arginine translocation protein TatB [hydrothermal vent metagenome]|uniref:Twin-arginine translocation protein TatB n=1 Tax=hydrothermal vent metagenome TaxID=652676 RepID=A0A3B0ST25_9ZZZZ